MGTHQVVIVGGGPVGIGLAIELGQRGIRCALVERRETPQHVPKGQSLTNRTAEHFHFWHCLKELRAARTLPVGYPIQSVTAFGDLMGPHWYREEIGMGRGAGAKSYFYQPGDRLPQYCTEDVLRRRVAQIAEVEKLFGWGATAFEQDANGVRVTIAKDDGSDQRVLTADYLVGCDGAHSFVREAVGIDQTSKKYGERMMLAVFRSPELHRLFQRFPEAVAFRVLSPDFKGAWLFFGRVDLGTEWFFHAPVSANARTSDRDVIDLMQRAVGTKFEAELLHVGYFALQISIAREYRERRAFIAGDACHSHPPYGGFGLNTGLEDARNLGWKLAAVLQGWGGEALLDSYGTERRPIFVDTAEFMIGEGIEKDRDFLERYHPDKDLEAFEAAWAKVPEFMERRVYNPHYEGSPIVYGPPSGVCGVELPYSAVAQPGHHLTPAMLSDGRNVFEAFGRDLTLLAFGLDDRAVARLTDAAAALKIPVAVIRDTFEGDRAAYGHRAVLVRPDNFVAWAGDDVPADPTFLLLKAVGGVGAKQ